MKLAVSLNSRTGQDGVLDYLMHTYVPYLETLGVCPVLVPNNLADLGAYLAALDVAGVVLTGGGDLDPVCYGQPNTHAIRVMPGRDQTEFGLLDWAMTHDRLVIGICRGIQTLNVYFGGGLVQDIPAQLASPVNHDNATHPVELVDDRIAQLLGLRELTVNTHHHQGITADLLAPELTVFAVSAPDGVIEGVLHDRHPMLGVQWHPERPTPSREYDLKLFQHMLAHGAFWVA